MVNKLESFILQVVSTFFAPTALRAIHQRDPAGEAAAAHPMDHFRLIFSAGEKLDMDTRRWAERVFKVRGGLVEES